jgi:hypothetical protein
MAKVKQGLERRIDKPILCFITPNEPSRKTNSYSVLGANVRYLDGDCYFSVNKILTRFNLCPTFFPPRQNVFCVDIPLSPVPEVLLHACLLSTQQFDDPTIAPLFLFLLSPTQHNTTLTTLVATKKRRYSNRNKTHQLPQKQHRWVSRRVHLA